MPFTPSHAVAALPFLRTPLPVAAVVMGSVAPDLPYFVPIGIPRELTHSLLGAVTIDPLIALLAVVLWWAVLRAPVVDLAPAVVRERMRPRDPLGRRAGLALSLLLVVVGTLVGIATHLVWDWFTHPAGFVDVAPLWRAVVGPFPIYRWLQYLSSVGGLVALGVWAWLWIRRTPRVDSPARVRVLTRRVVWGSIATVGVAVALGVWISGLRAGQSPLTPSLIFRTTVISIGVAGAIAVLVCLLWQAQRIRSARI